MTGPHGANSSPNGSVPSWKPATLSALGHYPRLLPLSLCPKAPGSSLPRQIRDALNTCHCWQTCKGCLVIQICHPTCLTGEGTRAGRHPALGLGVGEARARSLAGWCSHHHSRPMWLGSHRSSMVAKAAARNPGSTRSPHPHFKQGHSSLTQPSWKGCAPPFNLLVPTAWLWALVGVPVI